MPMSPRLLMPRASGTAFHPEATAWLTAVVANGGGTPSSATMKAVSDFCKAIDTAGIRDRFFRLNMFAGTGLAAALVPLYRGQSLAGTQYGSATDTNSNFVTGDYTETGASGGLMGNGSSKSLSTGLVPFAAGLSETNAHMSVYSRDAMNSAHFHGSTSGQSMMFAPAYATFGMYVRFGGPSNSGLENATLSARSGHLIGQRSPGGAGYRNGANIGGTSVTSGSAAFASGSPPALTIFGRNNAGTVDSWFSGRLQGYSIGLGFTDAQASAYYTAMQAFQTALSRNA